jgi:hypothetical protein
MQCERRLMPMAVATAVATAESCQLSRSSEKVHHANDDHDGFDSLRDTTDDVHDLCVGSRPET